MGDIGATIQDARQILRKAKEEGKGQSRGLRLRQAAEKIWLAASTAADAMSGGTKVEKSAHVFRLFERAWGVEGRELAIQIEQGMHRGCFYSNACSAPAFDLYAAKLGKLFAKGVRDREIRSILSRKNRG